MERREFCAYTCRVVSVAALGSMVDACSSPTSPDLSGTSSVPRATGSVSGGKITVQLSTVPSLATIGGVALIVTSALSVLVSRQSDTAFTAVTAICTHEGCTVDRFMGQTYVCSCHGSEFTVSGAVVHGPASRSLESFPAQLANDTLTVTT
jgi:cytochrome b6-f complex iron-sulfur subunit